MIWLWLTFSSVARIWTPGPPELVFFVTRATSSSLWSGKKQEMLTEALRQEPRFWCVVAFRITRDMPGHGQWWGSPTRVQEQRSDRSSPASWLLSHSSSRRLSYSAGLREHQHQSRQTLTENIHFCLSPGMHITYNESIKVTNLSASPVEVVSRTCFCLNPQKGIWPPSPSSEEGCGVVHSGGGAGCGFKASDTVTQLSCWFQLSSWNGQRPGLWFFGLGLVVAAAVVIDVLAASWALTFSF